MEWCRNKKFRRSLLAGKHLRNRLPVIGEKSVARFIAEMEQEKNPWLSTSCFVVPRVLIGPAESSTEEVSKQATEGLDAMSFHTLRYRKFKTKRVSYTGKSLVDASQYRGKGVVSNPHKINPSKCLGRPSPDSSSGLLKVHHYSGSFETFASHRGDDMEYLRQVHACFWV
jgi:hypothetical protein